MSVVRGPIAWLAPVALSAALTATTAYAGSGGPLIARPPIPLSPSPAASYSFDVLPSNGGFVVADFSGAIVNVYEADGKKLRSLGRPGQTLGELQRPVTVAVSGTNAFVYDVFRATMLQFSLKDGSCLREKPSYESSPFGAFLVRPDAHYRMGYLAPKAAEGRQGCVAFRTDSAGQQPKPVYCYDDENLRKLNVLNEHFGYVDGGPGGVYYAFPVELKVRVFDDVGKTTRSFDVGGSDTRKPVYDDVLMRSGSDRSLWLEWRRRATLVSGLAVLADRVVVLISDPEPKGGWRLESYDPSGKFLSEQRVGETAAGDDLSVFLRGNGKDTVYLLVKTGKPERPAFEIHTYVVPSLTALRGFVRDEDGKPVPKAEVRYGTAHVETGDDGAFSLDPDGPEKGELTAARDGFLPATVRVRLATDPATQTPINVVMQRGVRFEAVLQDARTRKAVAGTVQVEIFATGRPSKAQTQNLTVRNGALLTAPVGTEAGHRIFISSPGHRTLEVTTPATKDGERRDLGTLLLQGGLSVSGRVLLPSGEPAVGARVVLRSADLMPIMQGKDGTTLFQAGAGPDGRFVVKRVAPGAFELRVEAKNAAEHREPLTLSEDLDRGDIALEKGCRLEGNVRTLAGDPVNDAHLELRRGGATSLAGAKSLTTADDGAFRFENLAQSGYVLVVKLGGRKVKEAAVEITGEACDQTLKVEVGGTTIEGLVTLGGQPQRELPFILRPSTDLATQGFETTLARSGPERAEPVEFFGAGARKVYGVTDGSGFYQISFLEPGSYIVGVEVEGRPRLRNLTVPSVSRARVDIELQGQTLEGTVQSEKSREPLSGATVTLGMPGASIPLDVTRTDAAGAFRFLDLADGPVRVTAVSTGYESAAREVVVGAGGTPAVDLRLTKATRRVRGSVATPNGPAVGGKVLLETGDGLTGSVLEGVVQPDGTYEILDVPLGSVQILAWAPGWGTASAGRVVGEKDDVIELSLVLSAPGVAEIPRDASGISPRISQRGIDLTLLLFRVGIVPVPRGGSWVIAGLGAGEYVLRIGEADRTVTVKDSPQKRSRFLGSASVVRVRLRRRAREPVSGSRAKATSLRQRGNRHRARSPG